MSLRSKPLESASTLKLLSALEAIRLGAQVGLAELDGSSLIAERPGTE